MVKRARPRQMSDLPGLRDGAVKYASRWVNLTEMHENMLAIKLLLLIS